MFHTRTLQVLDNTAFFVALTPEEIKIQVLQKGPSARVHCLDHAKLSQTVAKRFPQVPNIA